MMMTAARMRFMLISATCSRIAAMFRMNILAGHSLKEGHDKTSSASAARMHIESDDTYQIPSDQQSRKNLCRKSIHLNLQS